MLSKALNDYLLSAIPINLIYLVVIFTKDFLYTAF